MAEGIIYIRITVDELFCNVLREKNSKINCTRRMLHSSSSNIDSHGVTFLPFRWTFTTNYPPNNISKALNQSTYVHSHLHPHALSNNNCMKIY